MPVLLQAVTFVEPDEDETLVYTAMGIHAQHRQTYLGVNHISLVMYRNESLPVLIGGEYLGMIICMIAWG